MSSSSCFLTVLFSVSSSTTMRTRCGLSTAGTGILGKQQTYGRGGRVDGNLMACAGCRHICVCGRRWRRAASLLANRRRNGGRPDRVAGVCRSVSALGQIRRATSRVAQLAIAYSLPQRFGEWSMQGGLHERRVAVWFIRR